VTQPLSAGSAHLVQLRENIDYARNLITGGVALQGIQSFPGANYGDLGKAHPEDLFRAAWTQSVAALDYWLHEEIIDKAVTLANDTGRERPPGLLRLRMPVEMVERARWESFHVVFREFLRDEYRRTSFLGTDDIASGFRLVTQLKPNEIWTAVGTAFGMTALAVKERHDKVIIKRRNDIAHRADRDAHGKRQPITADEASATVTWISNLVQELALLLG
jgi:hypothetical protein